MKLEKCSDEPLTGYFRDSCCNTDDSDIGSHTVCAVVSEEFLEYSKAIGNDLSTPRPELNFPGLQPGDKWCVCAERWMQALKAGVAPKVYLEATHEKAVKKAPRDFLIRFAWKGEDIEI
ncbi:MAG: DUF2237 domain-containing protein [Flavobacteriales bacterium]|nr:DUF2237 domain-containing protein [Flavobacteriales bacterium]